MRPIVQARGERGIHARRRGNAVPNHDVEAGYRLSRRRCLRQLRHRPHRGAGESAYLAFLDLPQRGRDRNDRGIGFVAQQRREHFRARAIDHVDLVDPRQAVEIGHEQMRPIAEARGRVIEFTGLLLGGGDEFRQRRIGQRRPDQYDRRQVCCVDDRRKGRVRIVRQFGAEHVGERAQDRPVLARLARREGGAPRHLHPSLGIDVEA